MVWHRWWAIQNINSSGYFCTEPITSLEEIESVVDIYRARWLIGEYSKALKTECQYQARQMETFQALEVVLGLLVPIAWKLLELRWASCEASGILAHEILSHEQILVLNTALLKNRSLRKVQR